MSTCYECKNVLHVSRDMEPVVQCAMGVRLFMDGACEEFRGKDAPNELPEKERNHDYRTQTKRSLCIWL